MSNTMPLQQRDIAILEFIAKFGIVNDLHLMHAINLFEAHNKLTRPNRDSLLDIKPISQKNYLRILSRLSQQEYIKKTKLIAHEFNYISLAKHGGRFMGVKPNNQLVLSKLRHDMLVLDLYCHLSITNPEYEFTSEYKLKQHSPIHIADKTKIPDLLINDPNNPNFTLAIEMELSQKNNAVLTNIILNYIYNPQITEVWYFVLSIALGNKIHAISGANCKKIRVFLISTPLQSKNRLTINFSYTELPNLTQNKPLYQHRNDSPRFAFFDLSSYLTT